MILIYKLWEYLMEIRDEHFKRMILISMQILYELFFILEFYMRGNFIEILFKIMDVQSFFSGNVKELPVFI